jgi:two-component system phosphate regulon sensor histidine kinase PhoR
MKKFNRSATSLGTALIVTGVFLVCKLLFGLFFNNFWLDAVVAILIFMSAFSINYFYIVTPFHKKLSTILKNILQKKNKSLLPSRTDVSDERLYAYIIDELNSWESEKQLEIDELKKAETYRREFLGNVSHELKTPLFSAQGYVHTLLDGGLEDMDINMLYLQKAAKSLDRLIAMVDDLEAISKLETGEVPLEMQTFDINDLVKDVFESLELKAREKNIHLVMKEIAGSRIYVYADKDRIRQVLVNLIENSIKYGNQNGTTTVRCFNDNTLVHIEVADNGLGIEEQYLPRLFERFFRVDKSRSREIGGTGLGLAIVKHIIEAHQQSIMVDSIYGKGTTFSFSLKASK